MATKLTLALLRSLKPEDAPYEIRAVDPKGLIVRVQPSGKRTFYFEHARGRREKIGDNGDKMIEKLTLTQIKNEVSRIRARGPKETRSEKLKITLGGFIEHDYADYIADKVITHKEVLRILNNNFKHLYSKRMTDIQPMDIDRWKRKRQKEVAHQTVQLALTHLKACLNCAQIDFRYINNHNLNGYSLKRSISASDKRSKTSEKKIRYLSENEEEALREALDRREDNARLARDRGNSHRMERGLKPLPSIPANVYTDHLKPIVLLALNTGLRRGDIFSLRWSHVDFKLAHIHKIIDKTRRKIDYPQTIPLSEEAISILRNWHEQSTGSDLVFPSPITKKRLDNIKKSWDALLVDAQLNDFRFHDLRHTFATRLVMAGIPLNTVRELMCHADMRMTLVYAHLSPGHKADAIAQVFNRG